MNRKAFTLAEVLITLGIIGVVAALTLPSLIANYRDKQTVTQLKKAYSTIAQAYEKATFDEGTPDTWGLNGAGAGNPHDSNIILNILSSYIMQLRICENAAGCWPDVKYKQLNGTTDGANINTSQTYGKAIINDGMLMYVYSKGMANCDGKRGTTKEFQSVCATFTVDVNGYKRPNTFGKDTFSFIISKYGIYPQGSQFDTSAPMTGGSVGACDMNIAKNNSDTNGLGCTAWVLQNENLDYLHCQGIGWNGKTKCN
ncbi:MAG: type II secretion system GspH family protein [Clostridiaceae bacterium]|jgi:prepilin-type N-terminal cleavage/methylation domain-containing protein|nr:type II secretion system GspH family protein [Clostridiaceae bacterium]